MLTRSYRTPDSPIGRPKYATLAIGETVRFTFAEPPAFNAMLLLQSQYTHDGPDGRRMKKAQRRYWVEQQKYKARAWRELDAMGWRAPETPWQRVALVRAHFRLHSLRDKVELLSSIKWPIDLFVQLQYLQNDAPNYLEIEALPTQEVKRDLRGVDLWIRRDA